MLHYENARIQADARRDDLADEAQQFRLARDARGARKPEAFKSPIYGPALARAGLLLIEIGRQLQARYGGVPELPVPLTEPAGVEPGCC